VWVEGSITNLEIAWDLVAGSGIEFEDRGMHSLKGVHDEWRIFAAKT
jgi:hypothetical protein